MRIYVAGKWEEKERVREVQNYLKRFGHTITHDWTSEPLGAVRLDCALLDKQGVLDAEAFVGVFEKDLPYKGAMSELGIAVAIGIPIYILGSHADNNIFTALPEVHRGLEGLIGEYKGDSARVSN